MPGRYVDTLAAISLIVLTSPVSSLHITILQSYNLALNSVFFGVRRFVSKYDEKSLCDDTDQDEDEVDVEIKEEEEEEEEPRDCRSNTKTQFANFSGEK